MPADLITDYNSYETVDIKTTPPANIRQQALTRPRWDDFHQVDDMRITSYSGRYRIQPPAHNCPNIFPVNPTIRIQKHGNSWPTEQWRTDVESDLRGINYLSTRVRAEAPCPDKKVHYDPATNSFNNIPLTHAPDANFPTQFNRLENPPCTLRASGWNRFTPLLHNPQETFETPFDYFIPARLMDKEKCKTH
jgi:hypothetical protein